ncbi:ParB/RepB/Spo0J family partition protein [Vibrio mediterranei]|uniref:ParB/RepB/Spo0J family partition protein n=1 Tax=Vibrio mediterranei TaxID=689 RepID=UPI00406809C5
MGVSLDYNMTTSVIEKEQATVKRTSIRKAKFGNQRKRARNPRKFAEFRADIAKRGIDTPLAVRPLVNEEFEYELLAGYGRFEVAELENFDTVPVVIHHHCDDSAAKLIMSAENLQREDLHPIDQANIAKDMLAELGGDMEALAAHTHWNTTRIKRYFQLLRCTESVQEAVDVKNDNGFIFTLAHANELSGQPEHLQEQILGSAIENKMSVADLRKFIKSRLERALDEAIFSTDECLDCQFNKSHQVDLFSFDELEGSVCTNLSCFNEKHQKHLDDRLEALKADHGNVIFLTQAEGNYTPVSKSIVGEKKFTNDCLSCTKYTTILVDSGANIDTTLESQCLDLSCAQKKDEQLKTSTTKSVTQKEKEELKKAESAPSNKATKSESTKAQPEKEPKAATVTRGVITDSKEFIQAHHAPALCEHDTYSYALMLFALRKLNSFGLGANTVKEYMSKTPEALAEMVHKEIFELTNNTNGENQFNGQEMAIICGGAVDGLNDSARRAWEPSKENLSAMQNGLRHQMLEQSGFTEAFIAKHDEKAYNKLCKLQKEPQIEAILAFQFDWTEFCPSFLEDELV